MTEKELRETAHLSTRNAAAVISQQRGALLRATRRVSHVWVRLQRHKWKETLGGMKPEFYEDTLPSLRVEGKGAARDTQDPEHHQGGA